jgi:hypothetical protein
VTDSARSALDHVAHFGRWLRDVVLDGSVSLVWIAGALAVFLSVIAILVRIAN